MKNKFIKIYAEFLKKFLKPAKPLKVVFDCSNGTAGLILNYLKTKKLKTVFINDKPNGNFLVHGPNPWARGAMNHLKKEVLRQKADLGIIFDADGDRVFFIDNLGRSIEPDAIARLLIWQIQPKKIVYDVRTGWLVRKIATQNSQLTTSRAGHFYIKKLMQKIKADLGVEKSGHYYYKKFFYCDAGILTAIEIINAVSKLPYSLADFANLLPQYFRSGEINIKMNYELRSKNYEFLFKKIKDFYKLKPKTQNLKTINYLDGLTMEFSDDPASRSPGGSWWFNLRPSNTEPLIRLNIESESQKILQKEKNNLIRIISRI